jgi:hypothetical protein
METTQIVGMDNLLPTIEQAKLCGIIKEPSQINLETRQRFKINGIVIGVLITTIIGVSLFYYYTTKTAKEKEE